MPAKPAKPAKSKTEAACPRLAAHAAETLKRSRMLFGNSAPPVAAPSDCDDARSAAVQARLAHAGYPRVVDMPAAPAAAKKARRDARAGLAQEPLGPEAPSMPTASAPTAAATSSSTSSSATTSSTQLALINPIGGGTKADVSVAAKRARQNQTFRNGTVQFDAPTWHSPWKLMRVISGHLGWVRAIAFSPDNEWFVTGSADRTIKVWDVASGELKLTLTGHINTIRGLVVSDRHPYLFSCGEDRTVKCWDLNTNQVIRSYHGHLSGVYSLAMHPKLDVLVSGGRDSCARLWDMRTKREIHVLGGHADAVGAVLCQPTDPQIVTGSYDHTIRLWDIVAGRSITTLTNHKRGVRALVSHPTEFTFASAAADNIKKWQLPAGRFMQNINLAGNTASRGHNLDIVNALAINEDDVMVSGGDDGMLDFWDWRSGHCFQSMKTEVQPGSLDSEAAIYAMSFDKTGSRLFTCEADKTIKIWKEDETATEETHPIRGWDPKARRRARRH